jgi:hypothetical protein
MSREKGSTGLKAALAEIGCCFAGRVLALSVEHTAPKRVEAAKMGVRKCVKLSAKENGEFQGNCDGWWWWVMDGVGGGPVQAFSKGDADVASHRSCPPKQTDARG